MDTTRSNPPRDMAAEFDAHLRRHKEKNAGRGRWEYMTCSRCDDGRRPDKCPVAVRPGLLALGVCEYPRAVND